MRHFPCCRRKLNKGYRALFQRLVPPQQSFRLGAAGVPRPAVRLDPVHCITVRETDASSLGLKSLLLTFASSRHTKIWTWSDSLVATYCGGTLWTQGQFLRRKSPQGKWRRQAALGPVLLSLAGPSTRQPTHGTADILFVQSFLEPVHKVFH